VTAQAAASVIGFAAPRTVGEAIEVKEALGPGAVYVAGGTDLGVLLRRRRLMPSHLVSLAAVPELRALERRDSGVVVGGGVTHRRIEDSDLIGGSLAALREACSTVGSIQTRNVGTIGGNLANASPAADTAPALVALQAIVRIASPGGDRAVPVDEFFTGYRTTVLGPSDLVVAVHLPAADGTAGSAFVKLGRRKAMEISIACAAAWIELAPDGTVASARIGLGSVAPTTVRARTAEASLIGVPPGEDAARLAGEAALEACAPIDDVRATAAYRRGVIPTLVADAVLRAGARAVERP
jgi:carbon-monoxide dehydrogenase medium subunit